MTAITGLFTGFHQCHSSKVSHSGVGFVNSFTPFKKPRFIFPYMAHLRAIVAAHLKFLNEIDISNKSIMKQNKSC